MLASGAWTLAERDRVSAPPWPRVHWHQQARALASLWYDRLPHQAWALAVCALALLFGVAVVDDYGVLGDTGDQRAIGEATLRHLAGERGLNLLWPPWNRFYGAVFEAPLALVERIIGRDEGRPVYLARHLLTHLFFLTSAFVGYLLAHRLFGNRWLALFALLLLLLHPRIYPHSFFNSKDVPFLAMFTIYLWLAHRAFEPSDKGGVVAANGASAIHGAFALCGVAAGLLTNLRVGGAIFVVLVIFMRLCDVVGARTWSERRCAVVGCVAFALAAVATYYASLPYLWADPLPRFMEIVTTLSAHPNNPAHLFDGKLVHASEVPPSYLPVWFAITTPPLALLLGAVGFGALVWRVGAGLLPASGVRTLRNTPLRFELLLAACIVLPVLAAIALRPTLHSDWRHFYFLWAPFVLLATSGLRTLVEWAKARWPTPSVPAAAIAAGLVTIALGAMAVEMVRLHPHQHLYFNVLVSRSGAGLPLSQRFALEDWFRAEQGYAHILEELTRGERADAVFNVPMRTLDQKQRELGPLGTALPEKDMELFRQRDRQRLEFDRQADVDFFVRGRGVIDEPLFPPVLYERRLYGQVIVQVATPALSRVDGATAEAYRTLYRDITSATPALDGDIDVYRSERTVSWVKEQCAPGDVNDIMEATMVPLEGGRVYAQTIRAGGVRVGGACLWHAALPEHAVAKIIFPYIGVLATDAYLDERRDLHSTLSAMPPAARSTFDVYLRNGSLFYVKTPCVQADTEASFFVHVRPAHLGDLSHSRRRHGFDALDFRFGGFDRHWNYAAGDIFDGICLATFELPDYPLAGIATGQYMRGGDSLWRVDIGGG